MTEGPAGWGVLIASALTAIVVGIPWVIGMIEIIRRFING